MGSINVSEKYVCTPTKVNFAKNRVLMLFTHIVPRILLMMNICGMWDCHISKHCCLKRSIWVKMTIMQVKTTKIEKSLSLNIVLQVRQTTCLT